MRSSDCSVRRLVLVGPVGAGSDRGDGRGEGRRLRRSRDGRLAPDLPGEVRELGLDQLLPRELHGLRRAGHRDDDAPRYVPAVARESIAAAPTCSQLSIRKSSPKPGSCFSSIAASVS